ncbi:dihydrofolate reductase [Lactobacillus bombi]|nr:dihydrofolate reductase [Bombilactobacillus bombi]
MLAFIWAEDENHLIGQDGHLPWHLPADLHYFKEQTLNHSIIMGRKTFASLPQGALPQRRNIVLTHSQDLQLASVQIVHTKSQILTLISDDSLAFIIGGREIFSQFLNEVDYLYVTKIEHQFVGDVYMPTIDYQKFKLVQQKKGIVDSNNVWPYKFLIYQRYNNYK